MPSVEDVLFLTLLLWLFGSYGLGLLRDADTGMHIQTGEYILDHMTVPREDLFSYTKTDEPWVVHSWLSAVLFAMAHRWLGLSGVAFLSAFTISLTFLLLFRFLIRRQVDLLTAGFLVIMAASTSLFFWLARPQIFTTLLALIWYDSLDRYKRDGNIAHLFPLPLLMVLWVNLHGGYLTGLILLFIFLAGEILGLLSIQNPVEKAHAKMKIRSIATVGVACLLAALINPYGYEILIFPFRLMRNSYLQEVIGEWIPPSFHDLFFLPFELALLLLVVVLGRSDKKVTFTELGLILFWTHAALYSLRHIPIFAVIFVLLMGPRLTVKGESERKHYILIGYRNISARLGQLNQLFNKHVFAILIFLSVLGLTIISKPFGPLGDSRGQFNSRKLPVQAATFIKDVGLSGNMFNLNEFGGYLIYTLFPDYKVFVDGRADMYGEAFMKEYARTENLKLGWRDVLDQHQVNWIIGHTYYKLATLLYIAEDWKLIYSDEVASIFVRDVPENQMLIHRFPDIKPAPRPEVN